MISIPCKRNASIKAGSASSSVIKISFFLNFATLIKLCFPNLVESIKATLLYVPLNVYKYQIQPVHDEKDVPLDLLSMQI